MNLIRTGAFLALLLPLASCSSTRLELGTYQTSNAPTVSLQDLGAPIDLANDAMRGWAREAGIVFTTGQGRY